MGHQYAFAYPRFNGSIAPKAAIAHVRRRIPNSILTDLRRPMRSDCNEYQTPAGVPSLRLEIAYWPLPFDLQDGTWSCGIGFPFGAGTPAASPACSNRANTASVSSQSMTRSFTRLSMAFITAARYMANEG